MQRCELGSLDGLTDRYHKQGRTSEDEGFLYSVLWDVAHALCYMATGIDLGTAQALAKEGRYVPKVRGWNAIMHRDLKPGTTFLKRVGVRPEEPFPLTVVGDFGLNVSQAKIDRGIAKPPGHRASGYTPGFAPPEAPAYHVQSDNYSLGVTIHCLAIMSNGPMPDRIYRDKHPLDGISQDDVLKTWVRHCLNYNPAEHPNQWALPKDVWKAYKQ
jgi:serine/threonine protein kinase